MKRMLKGFTLVEIMIVVAIIAILAAVAIPNFVRYRKTSQMNACISNLKKLQTATEQYRMNHSDAVNMETLTTGTDPYIKVAPTCPAQGTYTPPADNDSSDWTCSLGTDTDYPHVLPGSTAATPAPAGGGTGD